jgi:hypothetical protein
MQNSLFHHASENGLTVFPENPKLNWDVSLALKHALIRVGSDEPMIYPQ